ncbi:MAG: RDD family protein [Thermodesulfovibrionaceae bacterium]
MIEIEYRKSKVFLRILAKFIDIILVYILYSSLSKTGLFLGIFYLLISDGIFKGKSVGKKFLRIKVINIERNESADFRDSILRNIILSLCLIFLLIPFIGWFICLGVYLLELIILVGDKESKRIGDYIAKTTVIEE